MAKLRLIPLLILSLAAGCEPSWDPSFWHDFAGGIGAASAVNSLQSQYNSQIQQPAPTHFNCWSEMGGNLYCN